MTKKKLTLTPAKKTILLAALRQEADRMDKYMRRIYDETAKQVEFESRLGAGDRVMLNETQTEITVFALRLYEPASTDNLADINDMISQLTMTRSEYRSHMASNPGVMEVPL